MPNSQHTVLIVILAVVGLVILSFIAVLACGGLVVWNTSTPRQMGRQQLQPVELIEIESIDLELPEAIDLERLLAACREVSRYTGTGNSTIESSFTIEKDWWRFQLHVPSDQIPIAPEAMVEILNSSGDVVATSETVGHGEDRKK